MERRSESGDGGEGRVYMSGEKKRWGWWGRNVADAPDVITLICVSHFTSSNVCR